MADGKVVIDVNLDSKDAEKSADNLAKKFDGAFQDKNGRWRAANGRFLTMKERSDLLGKSVGEIENKGTRASLGIGKIVTALGLVAIGSKAINMVTGALDGAISRYDTLTGFPSVLQMMGYSSEQSSKAIDRLSEGIDGLPTTLDSVAKTTQRLALMTGDLEGATETTLALNNAFLASGASAVDAERGLQQFVQMLSTGTVDITSWRTLQETMPIALNKTAEAFGFAGASAQNDLYSALKSGNITFDQFNNKIVELSNGTGGFAELAKTSSTGISTAWKNMNTSIVKGVASVIGAIDQALGGTGTIAGYFTKMKDQINRFFNWIVAVIPIIAALISTVKDEIAPWVPVIQNVVDTVKKVIIDRISTAVDFAKQIFASLRDFWQKNGQQILSNAITIFSGIWETVHATTDAVHNVVKNVLGRKVIPFIKKQLANIQKFWDENGAQIMEAVQNCFSFIQSVIEFVMPFVQFVIEMAWSAIEDIIGGAIKVIQGIIQVFTGIFTGDWSQLWEGIKKILSGALDLILGIMSLNFLGGIRKILIDLGKKAVGIVKTMWDDIIKFFKTFTDDAASKVSTMGSKVWTFVKNMATNFKDTVIGLKDDIAKKFQEIKDKIIEKVQSIDLFQIGKDIINGLISGIGSMASAAWESAKGIVENIQGAFQKLFNTHSPSRWMRDEIGKNLVAGVSVGMEAEEGKLLKQTKGMIGRVKEYASNDLFSSQGLNRLRGVKLNSLLGNMNQPSSVYSNQSTTIQKHGNTITNNITNNFTKEESSPSESAKKQKEQMQRLAMEWGVY